MKLILLLPFFLFQMGASSAFAGYFDSREAVVCGPTPSQAQDEAQITRACSVTSDCLPMENCIHGECLTQGGGGNCLGDTDCAIGEHCLAGRCVR